MNDSGIPSFIMLVFINDGRKCKYLFSESSNDSAMVKYIPHFEDAFVQIGIKL